MWNTRATQISYNRHTLMAMFDMKDIAGRHAIGAELARVTPVSDLEHTSADIVSKFFKKGFDIFSVDRRTAVVTESATQGRQTAQRKPAMPPRAKMPFDWSGQYLLECRLQVPNKTQPQAAELRGRDKCCRRRRIWRACLG